MYKRQAPITSIATLSSLPLWLAVVGLFVAALLFGILTYWSAKLIAPSETHADASENRQRMLRRVENKWITGFLENRRYYSYDEQFLPLPLRVCEGSRYDLVLSNPHESTKAVSPGKTLVQVFDDAGGELLILGEPGAGKTTLLLELARDLFKRANDDPKAPIPVVLMLSS